MNKGEIVLKKAIEEIGTKEYPKNSNMNKYGEWFGFNGVPWCAIFVSYCYRMANSPLGFIGFKNGFAGCQSGYIHFKEKGEITINPIPGDIVLYDWNLDGRYDHTGIYEQKLTNTTFTAIEGNTALGNNSNGGQVMRRTRTTKFSIFVHPKVLFESK
jgi:hypothetical protein